MNTFTTITRVNTNALACKNTFTLKTTLSEEAAMFCPYCGNKLYPHHDQKGYVVYVCPNKKCSYYKENKRLFNEGKEEHLKTTSKQYRFRYHYRDFKFTLSSLMHKNKKFIGS